MAKTDGSEETVHYSKDYLLRNIIVPRSSEVPQIVGWSGPARSGTTALLYLLASHPKVDRVYFQPLKTILRCGGPPLEFYNSDKIVCLKEAFLLWCAQQQYDPIDILLKSGIPASKITWITMLRNPVDSFFSWSNNVVNGIRPKDYQVVQTHTISFYHRHKNSGITMLPFVYDLLAQAELQTIQKLLKKIPALGSIENTRFDKVQIRKKFVEGQAADPVFYREFVKPTYDKGKLLYKQVGAPIDKSLKQKVADLCLEQYQEFLQRTRTELEIMT